MASAITDKGVSTPQDATFDTMVTNINKISTLSKETEDATTQEYHILKGLTAYARGSKLTGTMVNHGAVNQALGYGGKYTIPAGFHNGSGVITAPTDKRLQVLYVGTTLTGDSATLDVRSACNDYGIDGTKLTVNNFAIHAVVCESASKSNINFAGKVGAGTMTVSGGNPKASSYNASTGIVTVTGCNETVQLTDSSGNSTQYDTIKRILRCDVWVYAIV